MVSDVISQDYKYIAENINNISSQIKNLSENTRLLAVSKFHSKEKICAAIDARQRFFGENRVQEAKEKWPEILEKHHDIKLHLIGHLQTNKVKDAVAIFDVIESLDSPKLADKILSEVNKTGKNIELYVQVNIGGEPQKSGVRLEELDDFLVKYIKEGLNITGLMCIPPANDDPVEYFTRLKQMADRNTLKNLSMGMSKDYREAIQCGSTQIRIGTAIFGPRD